MQFNYALHHLLKNRNYPIAQFARDTGITRTHLYRILHGDNSPTLDTLNRMSKALQMPLSHFIQLCEEYQSLPEPQSRRRLR
ncbi:MAG: helix-turn-helix domain-containing protein [Sphaerochaetaceae bacterium]